MKYFLLSVAIILSVVVLSLLQGCRTLNTDGYLQKSYVDARKTVVYDKDAKDQGFLQESYLDRRRTTQYDKKGNIKGYWQQDYVDPRKTRFYKKK